jgi:hypothetical protein
MPQLQKAIPVAAALFKKSRRVLMQPPLIALQALLFDSTPKCRPVLISWPDTLPIRDGKGNHSRGFARAMQIRDLMKGKT